MRFCFKAGLSNFRNGGKVCRKSIKICNNMFLSEEVASSRNFVLALHSSFLYGLSDPKFKERKGGDDGGADFR
jgi:hypothetical protein